MNKNRLWTLLSIFAILSSLAWAQDGSWLHYSGSVFSFSYPSTWRVSARADRDVVVSDLGNPISVELALSPGPAGDPHKMTLNAQKHVMQFAQMNNMLVKFESVNEAEGGGIRLLSHVCSFESNDQHFCAANDPKAIDFSTVIQEKRNGILLVEMMHRPGIDPAHINIGRQIVQTATLER